MNLGRIANLYLRNKIDSDFSTLVILSTVNAFIILVIEIAIPMKSIDYYQRIANESPYDRANIFSRITFDWMGGLMKRVITSI